MSALRYLWWWLKGRRVYVCGCCWQARGRDGEFICGCWRDGDQCGRHRRLP